MYKAFLSYTQVKEYLAVMIENDLLDYNESEQTYKTTIKGLQLLKVYDEMSEFILPGEQQQLSAKLPQK
jgi:predicted transcriptional regulator